MDFNKVSNALFELVKEYVDKKLEDLKKNDLNDIVYEFDYKKSYPKGTYAIYKSGLIKSVQDTTPIDDFDGTEDNFDVALKCGWVCIVAGNNGVTYEVAEDLRTLTVKNFYTDCTLTHELKLPVVLYKGVHLDEYEYSKGDSVTQNGSLWICVEDTTKEKPGASKHWKLSVKKGSHNVSDT